MRRLGVLVLAFAAALAQAQTPTKKELAARVIALQQPGIEAIARNLVEQPALQLMQSALPMLRQLPQDKRDATAKAIEADARKYVEETLPQVRESALKLAPTTIGPVLEEKFSDEELKQLAAWLESPLNRKFQQAAAQMQSTLVQKLVADARPTIEPRLRALEQKMRATLIAASPAAAASAPARPASR
jgi:hypothetical protein